MKIIFVLLLTAMSVFGESEFLYSMDTPIEWRKIINDKRYISSVHMSQGLDTETILKTEQASVVKLIKEIYQTVSIEESKLIKVDADNYQNLIEVKNGVVSGIEGIADINTISYQNSIKKTSYSLSYISKESLNHFACYRYMDLYNKINQSVLNGVKSEVQANLKLSLDYYKQSEKSISQLEIYKSIMNNLSADYPSNETYLSLKYPIDDVDLGYRINKIQNSLYTMLSVDVDPDSAQIEVEGEQYKSKEKMSLLKGDNYLRIRATGYKTVDTTLHLTKDKYFLFYKLEKGEEDRL